MLKLKEKDELTLKNFNFNISCFTVIWIWRNQSTRRQPVTVILVVTNSPGNNRKRWKSDPSWKSKSKNLKTRLETGWWTATETAYTAMVTDQCGPTATTAPIESTGIYNIFPLDWNSWWRPLPEFFLWRHHCIGWNFLCFLSSLCQPVKIAGKIDPSRWIPGACVSAPRVVRTLLWDQVWHFLEKQYTRSD